MVAAIENNIADGTAALNAIVAQADGVQHTADQAGMARHYANVLFNVMRGGIYADNYTRITSYNVCYTKLLRNKCRGLNPVQPK